MYKLLIADDEAIERKAFRTIISKDLPEISEIIEAANGLEAVEAAMEQRPDIIIMDVKMPGLNGIEAMQKIAEAGLKARTVILTAYDDFNYIQQALKIGVDDYLLKPARRAKMVEVIGNLLHTIKKEEKKSTYDVAIMEKIEKIRPVIENQMITLLPQASALSLEIENCLDFLNISEPKGVILVFSCESSEIDFTRRFLIDKDLYDQVYEKLHAAYTAAVAYPISGRVFAVVFSDTSVDAESIAAELAADISITAGYEISWGAGSAFSHVKEMEASYFQSLQAMRGDYMQEEKEKTEGMPDYVLRYLSNKEEIFLQRFKALNEKETLDAIDEMYLWIFKNMANDFWLARNYTMGMVSLCIKYAAEMDIGKENFSQIMGRDYYTEVSVASDLWKLKKWFEGVVIEILGTVKKYNTERVSGILEKAQSYIAENYARDITLEKAAAFVNVSPTHLSRVFKRQSGLNFVDYITKVRMGKAKELLKNTDLSMKQISFETGFNDPNYFFKVFKSVVGITPGEYRNT